MQPNIPRVYRTRINPSLPTYCPSNQRSTAAATGDQEDRVKEGPVDARELRAGSPGPGPGPRPRCHPEVRAAELHARPGLVMWGMC